ncbi:MAG: sulfite exporter TauE/SafE family protein [Eubacteriales bacterium]
MGEFIIFLSVGIIAQMIDGTLGMAYGVSCSTFLRLANIPSAIASASVHFAEIFTTLVSGISHFKVKNVDKKLFMSLIIPGVIGGVIGAYLLSSIDDTYISPIISIYLIIMGVIIFLKAFKKNQNKREIGRGVYPLAFIGGLSDAMGGGGWGPVVTSTLVAADHDVKKTIGSVNAAEFFVTVAESITFFFALGNIMDKWIPILGLIVGGVIAAPFAAILCKKLPVKPLLGGVGVLIIIVNIYKLIKSLTVII